MISTTLIHEKEVRKDFWEITQITRECRLTNEELNIIIYLLTLNKWGILNKLESKIKPEEFRLKVEEELKGYAYDSEILIRIHKVFEYILFKIELELFEIIEIIYKISEKIDNKNYPDYIEFIIQLIHEADPDVFFVEELDELIQLKSFLASLTNKYSKRGVYNPYAGIATIGISLNKQITYFGQESERISWATGYLLLREKRDIHDFIFLNEKRTTLWPKIKDKSDLVISQKALYGFRDDVNQHHSFFSFFEDLTEGAKIISPAPTINSLVSSDSIQYRQFIIDNGALEAVIRHPFSMMGDVVYLIISKKKVYDSITLMVDLSFYMKDKADEIIDYDKLIDIIKNRKLKTAKKFIKAVKHSEIKNYNYSFNPTPYFYDNQTGTALNKLVEPYIQEIGYPEKLGRIFRFNNLNNDIYSLISSENDFYEGNLNGSEVKVTEDLLLIEYRKREFFYKYLKADDKPFFISISPHKQVLLKLITDKIEPLFLVNELRQSCVNEQLLAHQFCKVRLNFSDELLKRTRINCPPLNEQKAKVQGLLEAYINSKKHEFELNKELWVLKDETSRNLASLQHTFKNALFEMNNSISGVLDFFIKNPNTPITSESIYSKSFNLTFEKHFEELQDHIKYMSKILEAIDKNNKSLGKFEKINLEELILDAQKKCFTSSALFRFENNIDKKSFHIDGVYFEPFIFVRRNDFYNIFLNIISNAVHHGFKNKQQTNTNLVRISSHFDFKDYNCVIKIANNGVPFPKGFGQKELITFGEKTFTSKGNGIGGYDINKLVKENNGTFKILSNPEAEFPVAYILKFPLSEELLEEELSNNKNKG